MRCETVWLWVAHRSPTLRVLLLVLQLRPLPYSLTLVWVKRRGGHHQDQPQLPPLLVSRPKLPLSYPLTRVNISTGRGKEKKMMLAHQGPRNPRRGHLLWLLQIQRPTRTQQSRKERPLPIKRPLSPQTPRQRGPSPTVAIPRGWKVPPNPNGFPQAVANGPLFSCKYFKHLSLTSSKLYLCL